MVADLFMSIVISIFMFYVKELWYELLIFALNFQSIGSDIAI